MTISITGFDWVPDFARGFVRDIRPRWACEEIGLEYAQRLITVDPRPDGYFEEQPWGQVPVIEDDGIRVFESGAILLRIAEKDERLLPADPQARASTISWLFAALNSVEPWMFELSTITQFVPDEDWAKLRKPSLFEALGQRLDRLAYALGQKPFLVEEFSVADIAMATVLREAEETDLVSGRPVLAAYLDRCLARDGFRRALEAQLASFKQKEPPTPADHHGREA